jgi:nitrite reductase/ring-hydroxylating ferredoxin subunit
MERRDFLKSSCLFCTALGSGMLIGALESCTSVAVIEAEVSGNALNLPLSLFAAEAIRIVRVKGSPYTIAVEKSGESAFHAFLLRCTHADNRLDFTGSGFQCNLHGSRFDLGGVPVKGPAIRPLKEYKASVAGEEVVVSLAG